MLPLAVILWLVAILLALVVVAAAAMLVAFGSALIAAVYLDSRDLHRRRLRAART